MAPVGFGPLLACLQPCSAHRPRSFRDPQTLPFSMSQPASRGTQGDRQSRGSAIAVGAPDTTASSSAPHPLPRPPHLRCPRLYPAPSLSCVVLPLCCLFWILFLLYLACFLSGVLLVWRASCLACFLSGVLLVWRSCLAFSGPARSSGLQLSALSSRPSALGACSPASASAALVLPASPPPVVRPGSGGMLDVLPTG